VNERLRQLALAVASIAAAVGPVSAHFGPAEPPDFGTPECIVVADLRTTPEITLSYELGFDDTEPEIGHIIIEGSKTHQFFAWRGTVIPTLPRYEYRPYAGGETKLLPLWMNLDDLMRADAANDPSVNPDFHASNIGNDVLRLRADLAGEFVEVSTTPPRVPITIEQAMKGVHWNLTGVAPGVYQIVSYTFSPPFNAWEPRPGVVKVIDGVVDTPAVTLESIDGMSYSGQGWRVTGCVDTPAGSTVTGWYRAEKEGEVESEASWLPWVQDKPIATGKLDLCFAPERAGLLHVRVAVRGPDGKQTFAYAPDSLVRVDTPMKCLPGDAKCCDPAPAGMAGALQPVAAGSAAPAMSEAMGIAGALAGGAGMAGSSAVVPPAMRMPVQPAAPATSSGCAVTRPRPTRLGWTSLGALVTAAWMGRRRRLRG
jgi:hypothetical protein